MLRRVAALALVMGLGLGTSAFAEANQSSPALSAPSTVSLSRPAALPVLYASFGMMQAWDLYSTSRAMNAGAREANPIASHLGSNTGSMIGMKAAATVSTIFFAERLWRTNKVAAVVLMASVNGAAAAVSMHNMRNGSR